MEISNMMIYVYIILGTILEVAIYTFRIALTTRGNRILVMILGGIGNFFSITVVALVTTGITEDPVRALCYAAAYAIGTLIGVKVDETIAVGNDFLTIIVDPKEANLLIDKLRKSGFAFTVLEGKGREMERIIIKIATKRRREKQVIKLINEYAPRAMLINEAISTQNELI